MVETLFITSTSPDTNLELHFNLWDSDKSKIKYLDIGLMCEIKQEEYDIDFIVPKVLSCDTIKDLGSVLIEKNRICNNIFNCDVDVTPKNNSLFAIAQKKENNEKFIIQKFIVDDKSISCLQNRTIIRFHVCPEKMYLEYKKIYFRIRLEDSLLSLFTLNTKSKGSFFEVRFENNMILDFRVNDCKLLSDDLLSKYGQNGISIKKAHFLYITDFEKNITFTSPERKIRLFEKNNWKDYIQTVKNELIAYHMTINDKKRTISFLLKTQENKSSFGHIIVYALVVIFLAILANYFSCKLGF